MTAKLDIRFVAIGGPLSPTTVLLAGPDAVLGAASRRLVDKAHVHVQRAATAADFKGKARDTLEILAPERLKYL